MRQEIIIRQVLVGPLEVFSYVVACGHTREGVIIDPGGDEEKILEVIEKERVAPRYILNTHGHADHGLANEVLKQKLDIPWCLHEADARFFAEPEAKAAIEKELGALSLLQPDITLKDRDVLKVGDLEIQVIHTPGHSPGSVCYLTNGNLFTGDTLFVGAVGRTDLAGGSLEILLNSLKEKIITLPQETVVWPGHDYGDTPTSTIGREMQENPYITDFILEG
ncbi:MAG: MBL fold metallo-hydrolase [Deltaproteobacteria bacterium]|nr:MBL fold metallo-hydrolase [Deltaproteobacteria bacterium]MBW1929744.1 MBL fold metallo-hydrolase [Deltaproteobacteria bacterium]MBW2026181.1 MBL fold metallo-hydrolase [Deltaproteobacteria bacterium]MBW2126037.1 MBL fold metallo-hydrolase [Deltaproteobacteria bacterium]RLB21325.1 MAG: MBL fold metallo-hydrolase [Deltaproteobacteria bacterium]